MLKIIEIRKCLFKLQLKMSGVFFYETQRSNSSWQISLSGIYNMKLSIISSHMCLLIAVYKNVLTLTIHIVYFLLPWKAGEPKLNDPFVTTNLKSVSTNGSCPK